MSYESNTELRRCEECHRDLNRTEWNACKKNVCPAWKHMPLTKWMNKPDPVEGSPKLIKNLGNLTLEEKRKCVSGGGASCPYCLNTDLVLQDGLEESFAVMEDRVSTRHIACKNGHHWHEVWTFTGILTPKEHDDAYDTASVDPAATFQK